MGKTTRRMPFAGAAATGLAVTVLCGIAGPSAACVGTDCMNIWSTAPSGGALTMEWNPQRKVQTFRSLCAGGECLFSAIDPGFRAPGQDAAPADLFSLAPATTIRLELVDRDPAVTIRINGVPLRQPGDSALLGTAPDIHSHPSWQLSAPEGSAGDYQLAFRLETDSASYRSSEVLVVIVTNVATPTIAAPSATPTPTPTTPATACVGDCDGDRVVSISELVGGVSDALDGGTPCAAIDTNRDGAVAIAELVAAVGAALAGCPSSATPTPVQTIAFAAIRDTILAPRCALPTCHDAAARSGNLVLDAANAYDALVGVEPNIDTAREAGLLLVDPGQPDNSFLLIKLSGPPPDQGSRMPLTGDPLSESETALIAEWIAQGAAR